MHEHKWYPLEVTEDQPEQIYWCEFCDASMDSSGGVIEGYIKEHDMSTKNVDQFNYFTGYKYQGVNAQDLASKAWKSNQWATYHQWLNNGYQVQKGEHGTSIMLVKKDDTTDKTLVRYYKLFNFEQVAPVEEQ